MYKASEGYQKYHNYECQFNDVMTGLGCSQLARLALRIVTTHPYKYFLSLKGRLGSAEVFEGEDYLRLHRLVTLNEARWPEEALARAAMAVLLLSILKAAGFIFGTLFFNHL